MARKKWHQKALNNISSISSKSGSKPLTQDHFVFKAGSPQPKQGTIPMPQTDLHVATQLVRDYY